MGDIDIAGYEDLIDRIMVARNAAKRAYERRLFILLGYPDQLSRLSLRILPRIVDKKDVVVITSNYRNFREDLSKRIGDESRIVSYSNWETDRVLGQTFDIAVIDLRDWPDVISLSRVVGTVRGGGLIFLLVPYDYNTKVYYEEIVPPYYPKPPRKIMLRRLIEKSKGYPGVYIFDAKTKNFLWKPNELTKEIEEETLSIPESHEIPREIYLLAASQDQIRAINAFEQWKDFIILLANRGRGKSASVGLGLTGYALLFNRKHKRPLYVCLTSRSRQNVEEIFKFAKKAHDALGLSYDYDKQQYTFKSNILRLELESPHRAIKLSRIADVLAIDEVAAIPFHLIRRLIKAFRKIVFSGTVHGYEGTGRIFAIRFLGILDNLGRHYIKVELKKPIRYAESDPVEDWLFKLLFMDAEPATVDESILENIRLAKLIEIKPQRFFLGSEREENFLRSIIGILVTAHYRNNPKDILLMCDAPHHRIFALVINNIPLVALQVAEEGGIPQEKIQEMLEEAPSGHLIPDNILRYTGLVEFPVLKGLRIVRIATHPKLQGKGLGSLALQKLVDFARQENKNWVGASFGATAELLNFWLKNKFFVTNLSPVINPKTGEYSTIVIRPLDKKTKTLVLEANKQLKMRLLRELRNNYWELDPEVARQILKHGEKFRIVPHLTAGDVFRVGLYINFGGKLEACIDVVDELVKIYFSRMYNFLSASDELLLIKKIEQRRLIEKDELPRIRDIIKDLWNKLIRTKFRVNLVE